MTHNIITIIVALARWSPMSWLDRQRGTPKEAEIIPKLPALLGMGYLCALYTGHVLDWQAVAITASVAFAHNFGFGEPIGHALTGVTRPAEDGTTYESWQVGKALKENPWLALAVRGLLVGLWTLFIPGLAGMTGFIQPVHIDWFASLKIAVAFGIAFPLASHIVRYRLKMPTRTREEAGAAWAKQESIRGALIELLLILMLVTTLAAGAAIGSKSG